MGGKLDKKCNYQKWYDKHRVPVLFITDLYNEIRCVKYGYQYRYIDENDITIKPKLKLKAHQGEY